MSAGIPPASGDPRAALARKAALSVGASEPLPVSEYLTDLLAGGSADCPAIDLPDARLLNHARFRQLVAEGAELWPKLGAGLDDRLALAMPNRPGSDRSVPGGRPGATACPLNPIGDLLPFAG